MVPTAYIPTLDGRERLRLALDSLRGQTVRCDVVVVDNGSTDGTQSMVRDEFPECLLIELRQNHGFGSALNQAISGSGEGPILLLNNDVILEPGFVAEISATAEATGAEMIAGVLLRDDGSGEIDSAGVIADRGTLMAFDFLEGRPAGAVDTAETPLGPSGGAALYDRAAFNAVGGFDPEIFAYYEDLDLALRMRLRGYRCALSKNARGTHSRSATLGSRSSAKYGITGWSRGYLICRYGVMTTFSGAVRTIVLEGFVCLGQILVERTASGLRGRIKGWRAASGMPRRRLPEEGLTRVSTRRAILERLRRLP
ncbi:MAG TPA: glycosyltransferase family 2 protein [Solirubrobacterales bacterium]|nr:glycosyltransferase family 2 protein [Solirubrobacterales bacterium]